MTRWTAFALVLLAGSAIACGANDDKNEGGSCTEVDDCGGNLSCQPIQGRDKNYCCPTPPESSHKEACQPAK